MYTACHFFLCCCQLVSFFDWQLEKVLRLQIQETESTIKIRILTRMPRRAGLTDSSQCKLTTDARLIKKWKLWMGVDFLRNMEHRWTLNMSLFPGKKNLNYNSSGLYLKQPHHNCKDNHATHCPETVRLRKEICHFLAFFFLFFKVTGSAKRLREMLQSRYSESERGRK